MPLIFATDSNEKYITAESVYAVFDSKPRINKENLEYTNLKISSVASLVRSSRNIINAGKIVPPRELTHIIVGILAIDSAGTETVKKHIFNNPFIDIGCAIKTTLFIIYWENNSIPEVRFSNQEESILAFFYIILNSLYQLGTVAGIDIRDYADATVDSLKLKREEL